MNPDKCPYYSNYNKRCNHKDMNHSHLKPPVCMFKGGKACPLFKEWLKKRNI